MIRTTLLLCCCSCWTFGVPRQDCKDAGVCVDTEAYDWPLLFGGPDDQTADGIAVDADGNLFVAGTFSTGLELDNLTLAPTATGDNPNAASQRWGYVAKLRPRGSALWAKAFGGPTQISVADLAISTSGIVVAGAFVGALDTNTTVLRSDMNQSTDIFALKLDTDTGDLVWATELTQCTACATAPTGRKDVGGIAIDPAGDVYVLGHYLGHFGCDENNCTNADQEDLYFARFDGDDGALTLLNTGYTGTGRDFGRALVAAGTGVFYGSGEFGSNLSLPGSAELPAVNSPNIFAARFDSNGTAFWAVAIGATGPDFANAMALDTNAEPVLAGRIANPIAVPGENTLSAPAVCVLGLSAADGGIRWGTSFPAATPTVQQVNLAVTASGFLVAGAYNSTLGVGSINYESDGKDDIYLVALDADGSVVWSKSIGGVESDRGTAIASTDGDAILVGVVDSTVDFGAGEVTPTDMDAFVVRYDASGALQ